MEEIPHIIKSEGIGLVDAVVEGEGGTPVVVVGPGILFALLAPAVGFANALAEPVVAVAGGIDIGGEVAVVVGREGEVEPPGEEVALAVLERGHERVAAAVLLAEDGVLPHAGLHLFVHAGVGEAEHEAVGPRFAGYPYLGHGSLVVVGVVEPFYPKHFVGNDRRAVGVPLLHVVGIDQVVVVGVVLEEVDFVGESVLEALPEVDVRLVGIERAVGVGGVEKPVAPLLVGNDVDNPADGVGAETYGYYPLVDFDAVGKADGDVVQAEGAANPLLRHPVDKDFDVFAAEAVEHELHVGAYATRFAQLHAGGLGQGVAQVLGRVAHLAGIDRHGIVGRALYPAHPGRDHGYLVESLGPRGEVDVEFEVFAPFE